MSMLALADTGKWKIIIQGHWDILFSQLGDSGISPISVKGKGFTDIKMYVQRKTFFKR